MKALLKLYYWGSNLENVFFEGPILKEKFWKPLWRCISWGSNFENVLLKCFLQRVNFKK